MELASMGWQSNMGIDHSSFRATRLIPTLAGSQYGTIDTTYVAAVGDTVEIKFATTTSGVKKFVIDGDSVSDRAFIFFSATDKIEWNAAEITALTIDGVAAISGTTSVPNDGKIHTILATLAVDARIGTIFADYTGGQVFAGELLSVKISLAAGTVVANYVFDSGSDLYQLPRGEGLGSELYPNTVELSGVGFVNNGDDTYTHSGVSAGEARFLKDDGILIEDNWYHITFTKTNAGSLRVQVGGAPTGGFNIADVTGAGVHNVVLAAESVSGLDGIRFASSLDGETVSNISIKQLPDLTCLLTNFATTDWNRYTQQRNITHDAGTIAEAWVGDNLITNGGFDTDTDWTKGAGWTIGSGVLSGVAGTASVVRQDPGTTENDIYLSKIKVLNYSAGTANARVGAAIGAALTANGDYVEVIAAGAQTAQTGPQKDALFVGDIDNVSVQHLLEVA